MPNDNLQTGDDPERLTGTLPEGFELTPLEGIGRWAKMTHTCGDETTFVNPSPERLKWYTGSHRCGGTSWQEGHPQPVEALTEDTLGALARHAEPFGARQLDLVLGFLAAEVIPGVNPGDLNTEQVDRLIAVVAELQRILSEVVQ